MTDAAARAARATSFGAAAATYERGRPGYPADAVGWLLAGTTGPVADVGAGTGKLTRAIAATGREVIAIDPDAGMLDGLRSALPGVPTAVGRAERLPLGDGAVAAALFGQSWHWVDVPTASAEVARVLAPGGVLGMVWNVRDRRVPWVDALMSLTEPSAAERLIDEGPTVAAPFGELETATFTWVDDVTPESVVDLVASRSSVITASAEARGRTVESVRRLFAEHPDVAGMDRIALPYVTHTFRAQVDH